MNATRPRSNPGRIRGLPAAESGRSPWSARAYQVGVLPDRGDPRLQTSAGGDVAGAVWRECEHILGFVAGSAPGSAAAEIRWNYDPANTDPDAQSRLGLYLIVSSPIKSGLERLETVIASSRLNHLYELRAVPSPAIATSSLGCSCDIVRDFGSFAPLHGPELNANIPPTLLRIESFESTEDNDYEWLECVLGSVAEPAVISMTVEAVDVSIERSALADYQSHLEQAKRGLIRTHEDDTFELPTGNGNRRPVLRRRPLHREEPLADDVLRSVRRLGESLFRRHLRFHFRVLAGSDAVAEMLAAVVAKSALGNGAYRLVTSRVQDAQFRRLLAGLDEHRVVSLAPASYATETQRLQLYRALVPLAQCAPEEELMGAFRLPLAGSAPPRCIRKSMDPKRVDAARVILLGHDEDPGLRAHRPVRGLALDHLLKGGSVSGHAGSGKTTALEHIKLQLARWRVPFVVLEMVKKEHRRWKRLRDHPDPSVRQFAQELQVYTLGGDASPLLFNPLKMNSVSRDSHIESQLECYQAAMPMFEAFPGILAETLERVFDRYADSGTIPTFQDVETEAVRVLASKAYSGEVRSNLEGAIDVRLGSLSRLNPGKIFQCRRSVPSVDQLVCGHSLFEFDELTDEPASLMAFALLKNIRNYLNSAPWSGNGVRLVIIIDEAHRLVGPNTNTSPSEGMSDPRAHASDLICRMLVELRALGIGVIIADQHVSTVADAVLRSTTWKLAFRQVDRRERELIAGAMLLSATQTEELACLNTGEAFFFTEGYQAARKIRTVNLFQELDQWGQKESR